MIIASRYKDIFNHDYIIFMIDQGVIYYDAILDKYFIAKLSIPPRAFPADPDPELALSDVPPNLVLISKLLRKC